jgi:HlyD family secretion protein
VRRVEPAAFTEISALGVEEQRVHVVIDLSAEGFEAEALGHGFRVEARIVVERIEDAVQVPEGALFRFEDRWALFRLEGDRARRVAVQTGVAAERTRQILAGVEPGDRVLVYPSDLVEDGTKVACDAP